MDYRREKFNNTYRKFKFYLIGFIDLNFVYELNAFCCFIRRKKKER